MQSLTDYLASNLVVSCLVLFATTFIFVALKAFQQLNVIHKRYLLVLPLSFVMAATEVATISAISRTPNIEHVAYLVHPIGLGGGLGCMLSMAIDDRIGEQA